MPDNKGWKGHFFAVRLEELLPINNVWVEMVCIFKQPQPTKNNFKVIRRIDVEGYNCYI